MSLLLETSSSPLQNPPPEFQPLTPSFPRISQFMGLMLDDHPFPFNFLCQQDAGILLSLGKGGLRYSPLFLPNLLAFPTLSPSPTPEALFPI